MKITFYYNDGDIYEQELTEKRDVMAIECGVLRALYSIALNNPENFKEHYMTGYKVEDEKGDLLDSHIYKAVERRK